MFVPLWLIGLTLALLALLVRLAFRRSGGEMLEGQRRASPAPISHNQLAVLASPEVRAALDNGNKIEAIKLVRQRTGLGLKEAKDLIESQRR